MAHQDARRDDTEIAHFEPSSEAQWTAFLAESANATLFHDLRFLAYHPPGRFAFAPLCARRRGRLTAVIPGGVVAHAEGMRFVSPLGASVGGPATGAKLPLQEALALVEALQRFARAQGWAAIQLTLGPAIYHTRPSDTLSFALLRGGFQIAEQHLTFAIPLDARAAHDRFEGLFRATAANEVRAARRKGAAVTEGGAELLADFEQPFHETYARLGVAPTHTMDELRDLATRLPDRVRIFVARRDGEVLAATLVFLLNRRVAYSFYPAMSAAHANANGNKLIFAHLIDRLADDGFAWLDLGPSASLHHVNESVAFFKEGLGALGHARTAWLWRADVSAS
jgi:hypothetical protein